MRRCFTLLTVLVLCASSGCDDKNKEEVADVIVLSRSSVAFAQKGGTTTVAVATPIRPTMSATRKSPWKRPATNRKSPFTRHSRGKRSCCPPPLRRKFRWIPKVRAFSSPWSPTASGASRATPTGFRSKATRSAERYASAPRAIPTPTAMRRSPSGRPKAPLRNPAK